MYLMAYLKHSFGFGLGWVDWLAFAWCSLNQGAQIVGSSPWGNKSQNCNYEAETVIRPALLEHSK